MFIVSVMYNWMLMVLCVWYVDAERDFSALKIIKTRLRTRLKAETLDSLLAISLNGPDRHTRSVQAVDGDGAGEINFDLSIASVIEPPTPELERIFDDVVRTFVTAKLRRPNIGSNKN